MRTYISSALAGVLVLGLAKATLAATKGEFDNMCTQGLASALEAEAKWTTPDLCFVPIADMQQSRSAAAYRPPIR